MTTTSRSIARLGGALIGALTISSFAGGPSPASAAAGKAKDWGIKAAPANETSPILPPISVPRTTIPNPSYAEVIARVENMPNDQNLLERARRYGLDVLNLTWEDTGRYEGSSVGPNISDLTLQVREPLGAGQDRTHLLPVVRYPNYSDKTGDIAMNKIWIKVGNQSNRSQPVAVPLSEVLGNMRAYLSNPSSLNGKGNFLAKRDSHVLTSAQHVFMPLPAAGKVEFTPVLYNYQSSQGNPAVLTLMVTREGTSATIIENYSGDQSYQSWGQQLYFNNKGQRTTFTAERKSAVKARIDSGQAQTGDAGALDEGSDMVMVIQVPLVHQVSYAQPSLDQVAPAAAAPAPAANAPKKATAKDSSAASGSIVQERSDVEQAVIGHGADKGPFAEMANMNLVRDTQFPIRVTVQFYKATSNGVVSDADLKAMHDEIQQVYFNADYVGSLVVPNGDRTRPTAWTRGRTPLR
jgi:hypothetical protein